MSDPLIDAEDDAATPLTPEERDALIPAYIMQRSDLNEAEQMGVDAADRWAFARRRQVISEEFVRALHRRMFRNIWRWAGEFRTTPRNIGVEPWRIASDMRQLMDDARYWVKHATYDRDELAVRFHHR